jgi:hypothetical protein
MDALLDREPEQRQLEAAWKRARAGEPQLVVIWGRRRVGKTYLLSHFARAHRGVFFGATQQAEAIELGRLGEAIRRDLGDRVADLAGGAHFPGWEAALRWFSARAEETPTCLVLDEVPYLAGSTPGLASVVQVVWDHLRHGTRLMLILTGSAIAMMEDLMGPGGPLRGRPTLAQRLDPLDAVSARVFLKGLSPERYFEAYAACGGYPLHLRAWNEQASLTQNLLTLAASSGGLLLQDARSLLAEELATTPGYDRILAAVGRGKTRFGEIANDAGQRIEPALEVLTRAGFLRKALPVGAPKAARPAYEIADPYLAFWFSCIYAQVPEIEAGQGQAVLARIEPLWQRHLGFVFEEASRAHATRLVAKGRLPRALVVGRWWASRGEPCEVDVLGLAGKRAALLGEARWQRKPLDERDLEALRRKAVRVPDPVDAPTYALWGRAGITTAARNAGALGYALEDVLSA